jgi:carboxyl-terminal processing protease
MFQQAMNNEFSGIGTAVRGVKDGLRIVTVYPDSPAESAGVRPGDVITHANGRKLAGLPEEAATALVKGPEGTAVTLTVRRGERTSKRRVTRATIQVPTVQSRIANAGGRRAAYIALSTFGARKAHVQMGEAIRRAKRRRARGIVFDLRGNGGGLVTEAQLVASMFIADGPIVTTRGRAVAEKTLEAVGRPVAGRLPTVVLVDRGTASASEIVAGALQDTKRAKLVGTRTYGKGVFQEILPLDNGGALDITVGQYFLPSGRNLGGPGTKPGQGLKPDVRVEDDPATRRDEALDRALDVLAAEL